MVVPCEHRSGVRAISSVGTIDFIPTSFSPFRSNRPSISPTSPRCTPSGLIIT